MVSTMKFVRNGELDDSFAIVDIFLNGSGHLHDLLQKAAGGLLREAGKRDERRVKDWLELRYARRCPTPCCAMLSSVWTSSRDTG